MDWQVSFFLKVEDGRCLLGCKDKVVSLGGKMALGSSDAGVVGRSRADWLHPSLFFFCGLTILPLLDA